MEKKEFECRDLSILGTFWLFWSIKIRTHGAKTEMFESSTRTKRKGSRMRLYIKKSSQWLWRTMSWKKRKIVKNFSNSLASNYQSSKKEQNQCFLKLESFQIKRLSIETLMREVKMALIVKKNISWWINKNSSHFGVFAFLEIWS